MQIWDNFRKIDKMKEKNGSVPEKEGSKEDDTTLGNTIWCTCKNWKFYENMNTESCRCCYKDALLLGGKLENMECVTQNAFCLLPFVVLPVVFVHLYAWQVGILIDVNVKCEIIKCDKHQQQVTNKLIICITETKN